MNPIKEPIDETVRKHKSNSQNEYPFVSWYRQLNPKPVSVTANCDDNTFGVAGWMEYLSKPFSNINLTEKERILINCR